MGGEEGWQGEEVAGACWAMGDEGEDLGDETLLDGGFLGLLAGDRGRGAEEGDLQVGCRTWSGEVDLHC